MQSIEITCFHCKMLLLALWTLPWRNGAPLITLAPFHLLDQRRPDPGDREPQEYLYGIEQVVVSCQVSLRRSRSPQREKSPSCRCKVRVEQNGLSWVDNRVSVWKVCLASCFLCRAKNWCCPFVVRGGVKRDRDTDVLLNRFIFMCFPQWRCLSSPLAFSVGLA